MAEQPDNHDSGSGSRRGPVRRSPLPKPKLPGVSTGGRGNQAQPQSGNRPKAPSNPTRRPVSSSSTPRRPTGQRRTPGQSLRRSSTGAGNAMRPDTSARSRTKKEPATIEELIPVLIRHAVKRENGLNISLFDDKFMPRLRNLVPDALKRMEDEVINEYLVDVSHALYVAIVVGQFNSKPVLCGVRAAELAADLVERVLTAIQSREDKRTTSIRCANLLVGLTLNSVRLLESTSLGSQDIVGFTDRYERAVITTYGLKTQAEASGQAPWVGQKDSPLDKRIGRAINTMSNVFGEYIGRHGETLGDGQYEEVLAEFDEFMDRFSPYIEGGRSGAEQRRKKLEREGGTTSPQSARVEPLDIDDIRTRPAGVEIVLIDGRVLFASTDDARRIGEAADGEVDDTAKRERAMLEQRQKDNDDVVIEEYEELTDTAEDSTDGD